MANTHFGREWIHAVVENVDKDLLEADIRRYNDGQTIPIFEAIEPVIEFEIVNIISRYRQS